MSGAARPPLLEVRDLAVRFTGPDGVARAVDGVDLLVGEGETVGLVGESARMNMERAW